MTISPESLYMRLGDAITLMPDIRSSSASPETQMWLGKVYALVAELGDRSETEAWKKAVTALSVPGQTSFAAREVIAITYRALAVAELNAPAALQGAFIPVGNAFDAMAKIGKVLQEAQREALIVDPYMDATVLTDFAVLARSDVALRLLTDQKDHKPTLRPAVERWSSQYINTRPLEARLSTPRSLHDRLILVDGTGAWTLTQSFKDLAARSPASIVRIDPDTARLKALAYESMWAAAVPM